MKNRWIALALALTLSGALVGCTAGDKTTGDTGTQRLRRADQPAHGQPAPADRRRYYVRRPLPGLFRRPGGRTGHRRRADLTQDARDLMRDAGDAVGDAARDLGNGAKNAARDITGQ